MSAFLIPWRSPDAFGIGRAHNPIFRTFLSSQLSLCILESTAFPLVTPPLSKPHFLKGSMLIEEFLLRLPSFKMEPDICSFFFFFLTLFFAFLPPPVIAASGNNLDPRESVLFSFFLRPSFFFSLFSSPGSFLFPFLDGRSPVLFSSLQPHSLKISSPITPFFPN